MGETKREYTSVLNENVCMMYKLLKLSAVLCDFKIFYLYF